MKGIYLVCIMVGNRGFNETFTHKIVNLVINILLVVFTL